MRIVKRKTVEMNAKDWLFNLMIVLISLFTLAFYEWELFPILASFAVLFINALAMIKVRKNWMLFIIAGVIFYSNYSIVFANYLGEIESYFTTFSHEQVAVEGIAILLLFSMGLYLVLPKVPKKYVHCSLIKNNRYNLLFVIALCAVLVLIFIYGFGRPDMTGERGTPSPIYEYSIILFIIAIYYSGKNRLLHVLLTGIMALFALQNFIFGGRITGLQLIICWFLCFYINRLTVKKAVPIAIIGLLFLSIIGDMRASFVISLDTIKEVISRLMTKGGSLDTAYSSYFTSLTFILTKDTLSIWWRLNMFGRFLLSMVLGGSAISNSNLPAYTRAYYLHYFGGILPYYAYFYLGIFGIVLLFLYMKILFRLMVSTNETSSGLAKCLAIYLTTSTFRWYLYGPSQLIRGALLCCVCYLFAEFINNEIAKRTGRKNA